MRLMMILGLNPGPETSIELIQRRHLLQIQTLDQMSAQRSPDSFNLPLRRSITWPAVHQMNTQLCTQQPQVIAAEAGMVVQKQLAHDATPGHRLIKDRKKTMF